MEGLDITQEKMINFGSQWTGHLDDEEKPQGQIILTQGISSSPWSSLPQHLKSLAGLKHSLDIYVDNKNVQCGGNLIKRLERCSSPLVQDI